mmetsp:Transcript_22941/g.35356  ORF Transcript_22941/g.35356 Transcript_22941/m.35356 type:complete len:138 (+) Transcript_22941:630-1043(+)
MQNKRLVLKLKSNKERIVDRAQDYEDTRVQVKEGQLTLRRLRNQSIKKRVRDQANSLSDSLSNDTTRVDLKANLAYTNRSIHQKSTRLVDHYRQVGFEKSTGQFVSGGSVPRSRPTVFWEPQVRDLSFNFKRYSEQV